MCDIKKAQRSAVLSGCVFATLMNGRHSPTLPEVKGKTKEGTREVEGIFVSLELNLAYAHFSVRNFCGSFTILF